MPNLGQIFIHFSPELILVIGAVVVLSYDLAVRGRDALQPWIAIVALVASAAATLGLYGQSASIFEATFDAGSAAAPAVTTVRDGVFLSDGFTHFFRLVSALTACLVIVSGMRFMRGRTAFKGEFAMFVVLAALAMNLMAGSNDLIMIAVSIEFLSITSYILTGFLREDEKSIEGGLKYFLYGSITSAAMLFGLTYLYGIAGTTSLPALAEIVARPESELARGLDALILPALMFVLAGIGFKIALVPFHQWSPEAYEGAPTPVTSFLSVGPKAAGFAVLIRLFATVHGSESIGGTWLGILAVIAGVTMVVGNLAALRQTNVKRLLAYSSIAQAGYMLVGLAAFFGAGLDGIDALGSVMYYILAYVFTNLGAFAVVIAVEHATGSSEVSAFDGLARRSPILALALVLLFLSLLGIPPLSGFFAKFAVFSAAVTAGMTGLAIVGVLTGVIAAAYYFSVVKAMYFNPPPEGSAAFRPAPTLNFVVVLALVMTFVIGIGVQPFLDFANAAAAVVLPAAEALVDGH